jgi:hypothetical protein
MMLRESLPLLAVALVVAIGCAVEDSPNLTAPSRVSVSTFSTQDFHTPESCNPDTVAPVISGVSATPNSLWPPNHKMWTVNVSYSAIDHCGPVQCSLSVSSNEPLDSIGDGHTASDWTVVDAHRVQLRAERQGPGDGRVYTITVSCTDAAQNLATATATVTVPHDRGK